LSVSRGLDVQCGAGDRVRALPAPSGGREQRLAEFATTIRALMGLRDWFEAHAVTHVAMEATGVCWRPVWHVLEDAFELMLVNARHVKQAELAKGKLRAEIPALREALERRFEPHHALVIGAIREHLDFLDQHIDRSRTRSGSSSALSRPASSSPPRSPAWPSAPPR
jgi:hypothetical protein